MTDPPRLRELADSNVDDLLAAGRVDGPRDPAGDKRRLVAALTALESASFAQANTKPASSGWLRALALGTGLVILGGLTVLSVSSTEHAPSAPVPAPEVTRNAPAPTTTANEPAALPSINVLDLPAAGQASSAARSVQAPSKPAASSVSPSTTDELAVVERVRAQLKSGDAAGARRDLSGYRATFIQGRFVEEIDALDVETSAAEGATGVARAKGEEFLTRYPASPYARRVRSVLAALEKVPSP
jgi:hypothetical protein